MNAENERRESSGPPLSNGESNNRVPVARESTPTFLNIFRETRRRDYISNRFTINFEGGEELHDYRLALNVREVGFK